MNVGWTEERYDLAKRMWTQGESGSKIARTLGGVTRNAVIGKMHRAGLSRPPEATLATNRQRAAVERVAARPKPSGPRLIQPRPPQAEKAAPATVPAVAPDDTVRIFQLDRLSRHTCKWPIDLPDGQGFGFCGDECGEGDAYCPGHKARAYRPRKDGDGRQAVRNLERSLRRYIG